MVISIPQHPVNAEHRLVNTTQYTMQKNFLIHFEHIKPQKSPQKVKKDSHLENSIEYRSIAKAKKKKKTSVGKFATQNTAY